MPNDKKVKGIVTGALFGICTNIAYEDGCQRPGDKGLVTNPVVISETSTINGICEHVLIEIREPFTPAPKPEPIRPTRTVQPVRPAALTVDQIVKQVDSECRRPHGLNRSSWSNWFRLRRWCERLANFDQNVLTDSVDCGSLRDHHGICHETFVAWTLATVFVRYVRADSE